MPITEYQIFKYAKYVTSYFTEHEAKDHVKRYGGSIVEKSIISSLA